MAKLSDDEVFHFNTDVIYLYCPNGYGKTKLTNQFFESFYQTEATTRNWKTVNQLATILNQNYIE